MHRGGKRNEEKATRREIGHTYIEKRQGTQLLSLLLYARTYTCVEGTFASGATPGGKMLQHLLLLLLLSTKREESMSDLEPPPGWSRDIHGHSMAYPLATHRAVIGLSASLTLFLSPPPHIGLRSTLCAATHSPLTWFSESEWEVIGVCSMRKRPTSVGEGLMHQRYMRAFHIYIHIYIHTIRFNTRSAEDYRPPDGCDCGEAARCASLDAASSSVQ